MTRLLDVVIDTVIIAFAVALVAAGCRCSLDPKDCALLRPHCLDEVDAGSP